MTELEYVGVNQNGYTYCSFPYYWTSETSVVFENLHIPVQISGGAGVNLFTAGPGRFQARGDGLDCTPPTDANNSILDVKFGYYSQGGTPQTPYYLLSYQVPNGIDGTLEIGNAYIKLNGTTVAVGTTYTGSKVTLTEPFYFFNSFNTYWAHNYIKEGHCGKVKFYENGVLTAVYTPYLDDNGVAGYYDENNQVMIYSLENAWVAGPDAKSIKATPSKTKLASTGETISIEVATDNAWTVTGNTFLTLSSTGDTGSTTITATAPSYSGAAARRDTLTFTDAVTGDESEITITQKKYQSGQPFYLGGDEVTECYVGDDAVVEAYLGEDLVFARGQFQGLKVTPTELNFNPNTTSASTKVKSSEHWEITSLPAWLSASTMSGDSGETIVTFENISQSADTAETITFSSATFSARVSSSFVNITYTFLEGVRSSNAPYWDLSDCLDTGIYVTSDTDTKFRVKYYGTGVFSDRIVGFDATECGSDDEDFRYFPPMADAADGRINDLYGLDFDSQYYDITFSNLKVFNNLNSSTISDSGVYNGVNTGTTIRIDMSVNWIKEVEIIRNEVAIADFKAAEDPNGNYGLYNDIRNVWLTRNDLVGIATQPSV